jgi:hypothetical protein
MSFTRTSKAVVVSCSLAASEQITVDLTVTVYQVQARVRESQYEDDVYMVKVIKPEGVGDLIDEEGTLLEHGRFTFDSTEEIAIDTELEIEITGVGSSTDIPLVDAELTEIENALSEPKVQVAGGASVGELPYGRLVKE